MSTEGRLYFTPNLVIGVTILLVGIVLTADRLGLIEAALLLPYWPALLILFGAAVAWQALGSDGETHGVSGQRPIVAPPLVLALVILGLLVAATGRRGRATGADPSETVSVHAVLSGNRHTSHATAFRGGYMTSVMGSSSLDLRQAQVAPGEEVTIDVLAVMGAVVVLVPRDWTVDVQALPVMGGVKDERSRRGRREPVQSAALPAPVEPEGPVTAAAPPRLVLRGFIMMGGLVIRS